MFETNPYLSQVHYLDKGLAELLPVLKKERYDLVIDLHNNLRSLKIKRKLGVPSHSFPKLNLQKWLLVNFRVNLLPPVHIVDRYLDTLKDLLVENDGKGLDYYLPEATSLPETVALPDQYVAFAIGGQHATKQLPAEKIVSVIAGMEIPVVLLGGKEDTVKGEGIEKALPDRQVINLCGALTLHQSALVVKKSTVVITHDTGLMHIAAAFDKPVLSVWGNTVPAFGMYPYFAENSSAAEVSQVFEVQGLPCRPCSKIGYDACPRGHFKCMNLQDTQAISRQAAALFAQN